MSRKHVEDYFNKICDDYHEMIQTLKDMEEECNNGLVSPDRVEQLKRMIEPIKLNYGRISYIMYLLNMPQRDKKKSSYERQHAKLVFPKEYTLDGVRSENKECVNAARKSL